MPALVVKLSSFYYYTDSAESCLCFNYDHFPLKKMSNLALYIFQNVDSLFMYVSEHAFQAELLQGVRKNGTPPWLIDPL